MVHGSGMRAQLDLKVEFPEGNLSYDDCSALKPFDSRDIDLILMIFTLSVFQSVKSPLCEEGIFPADWLAERFADCWMQNDSSLPREGG